MLSLGICNLLRRRVCSTVTLFLSIRSSDTFMVSRPSRVAGMNYSSLSSSSSSFEISSTSSSRVTSQDGDDHQGTPAFGSPAKMQPPEKDPFEKTGLQRELMPKHVAAILDGNRRWAKVHGKELDYEAFCYGYVALADLCIVWGIPTLTCFIFSTENWKRTKEANDQLFQTFKRCLETNIENLTRKGIKVSIIGEKTKLPKNLQDVIKQVVEATKNNSKLELNFAVNYGGKWDIAEAIKTLSRKAKAGEIKLEDVDEDLMDQQLSTSGLRVHDPDLMIRTGGDQRISNFLVWQMSHTEFYFTRVYGPDFGESNFIDALRWFQQSDRLFGK